MICTICHGTGPAKVEALCLRCGGPLRACDECLVNVPPKLVKFAGGHLMSRADEIHRASCAGRPG